MRQPEMPELREKLGTERSQEKHERYYHQTATAARLCLVVEQEAAYLHAAQPEAAAQ